MGIFSTQYYTNWVENVENMGEILCMTLSYVCLSSNRFSRNSALLRKPFEQNHNTDFLETSRNGLGVGTRSKAVIRK